MINQNENWKITPEKALKMLADEGMNVTLDQAAEILSFLRLMAEITVKKFLKGPESVEAAEDLVLYKKYEKPTKSQERKNDTAEGKIYCGTCNFLNNNF
ncbi:hypothetical protein [Flavobacterium olei]|uniref:hypothetical protein n=1 Tax=Flavobacterium olei TaxID=1886782 RepID=UPI00321AFAE1